MARSDLLLNLVRAGSRGDQQLFRKVVEAIAAEERAKKHKVLADRLEAVLRNGWQDKKEAAAVRSFTQDAGSLFYEVTPDKLLEDLILPEQVLLTCRELIEERQRTDLLRSHNLEPRNRVLFVGPPGNGKTSLAHAIAHALVVPLYVVRYEGLIGSFLGETASRLKKLFDYVRGRTCVLFFDEFDTLGKERGDVHETGEIKRVVSSLLLQIDDLPSHVLVITATNHQELLDRAVWRRFQVRLQLPAPGKPQVAAWFERFEDQTGKNLKTLRAAFSTKMAKASFAELEEFCLDAMRQYVLRLPEDDMEGIVRNCLKQWQARFKAKS